MRVNQRLYRRVQGLIDPQTPWDVHQKAAKGPGEVVSQVGRRLHRLDKAVPQHCYPVNRHPGDLFDKDEGLEFRELADGGLLPGLQALRLALLALLAAVKDILLLELVSLHARADTRNIQSSTSRTRRPPLITLSSHLRISRLLFLCWLRSGCTFFFCFLQALQPRPDGTPGMMIYRHPTRKRPHFHEASKTSFKRRKGQRLWSNLIVLQLSRSRAEGAALARLAGCFACTAWIIRL